MIALYSRGGKAMNIEQFFNAYPGVPRRVILRTDVLIGTGLYLCNRIFSLV